MKTQIQDYLKHSFPIMSDSMVETLSSGIKSEVDGVTDPAQRETKISNFLGKEIGFDKSLTDHIASTICKEVTFDPAPSTSVEDYKKIYDGETKEKDRSTADLGLGDGESSNESGTSTLHLD